MRSAPTMALGAGLLTATVAPACSCDDDPVGSGGSGGGTTAAATTTTTAQASTSVTTGQGGDGGIGQGGDGGIGQGGDGGIGQGGDGGQGGQGGSPPVAICDTVAPNPTRGSAIGISGDDSTLVSVNRDLDTVTITRVDYTGPVPAMTKLTELPVGLEPWQVAVNACGNRAYAVSRVDQQVVEIVDLETDTPAIGATVGVGSEPTGIAISPFNTRLYVSNWVEGTVTVIDTEDMSVVDTIDLNQALVDTGYLGTVTSRVGLAHPRAIAITNDGDEDDSNEKIVVTEWFAQRVAPEADNGLNSDVNKEGLVYVIDAATGAVEVVNLPAIANVGINNRNNLPTGCFPNQIGSVTISGDFAYVTSTCASPVGPIGVNVPNPPIACTVATQTADCPANTTSATCNATTLVCNPNTQDVKTTTHPALHIVNLTAGTSSAGEALDTRFSAVAVGSARMPLLPTDIGFFNDFAYVTSMGADAAFRVEVDGDTIVSVGADDNDFIDMRNGAADTTIRLPIGIATANGSGAFAFVANDGSRDVTALALASQSIAGAPDAAAILQAADLPTLAADIAVLRGKRFFNTGLGRWSLGGQAWGACAACHIDGLTDNVTWYFGRGPRQSVSLDGSFNSADPDDQRIFNWTGIFDEFADFEGNVRGISGGLGAIVDVNNARLSTAGVGPAFDPPPQQGLQGSSRTFADPAGPSASVLEDWNEIEAWAKTIRSPKAPVGLDAGLVDDGREIFTNPAIGNCVGCHSGGKWTISTIFYQQNDTNNTTDGNAPVGSLQGTSWNVNLNSFPAALLPADATAIAAGNDRMRLGVFPASEQIQCILRPVGTMQVNKTGVVGTSPAAVNVRELRQNMVAVGQGLETTGRGFNPPSLLGIQVGAPYYHGGNARTLEEAFDDIFAGHHQSAIASVFDPSPAQKAALIEFLLSIDESTASALIPAKGDTGGDLCFAP